MEEKTYRVWPAYVPKKQERVPFKLEDLIKEKPEIDQPKPDNYSKSDFKELQK